MTEQELQVIKERAMQGCWYGKEEGAIVAYYEQDIPKLVTKVERLQSELDEAVEYADYRIKYSGGLMRQLSDSYIENGKLQTEIERLRKALDKITDLENFDGKSREYYQERLAQAFIIACQTLEVNK